MNESELVQKAKEELVKLGYSSSNIYSEFLIQGFYKADIVVIDNDEPYIIVEVKNSIHFIESKSEFLKFDPSVKQAQSFSNILKTPFFAIYNGSFLWFSTDQTGRPELRKEPVLPLTSLASQRFSKVSIVSLMQQLRNYMTQNFGFWSIEQVGVLLYAQLLNELNRQDVKQKIIEGQFDSLNLNFPVNRLSRREKDLVGNAFSILEKVSFTNSNREDLLLAIDEVFNQARRSLFLPRWVADLMVKISSVTKDSEVLDLSSSDGNILVALTLNVPLFNEGSLKGTISNIHSEYWVRFQEILVLQKESSSKKIDISYLDNEDIRLYKRFNKIFIAPLFGGKVTYQNEHAEEVSTDNLEFLLEKALNVVSVGGTVTFIVPETFLFSNRYRRARYKLNRVGRVITMISLPVGTFEPYSSVKTSLIVFKRNALNENIFVGKIETPPSKDTFNCREIAGVEKIITNYLAANNSLSFQFNPLSYLVSFKLIGNDNLSLAYHSIEKPSLDYIGYDSFPLIHVSKIIKRGIALKRSENGKIPFIGPKAVRQLNIDQEALGYTANENVSQTAIKTNVDDVLINAISTYKGEAAIITKETENLLFAQHVILIRPDKEIVMPEYLAILLNSKFLRDQLDQIASGAVISFIPINLLREISIPVPPKYIQQQIIDRVRTAQTVIKSNEEALIKSKEELKRILENLNTKEGEL